MAPEVMWGSVFWVVERKSMRLAQDMQRQAGSTWNLGLIPVLHGSFTKRWIQVLQSGARALGRDFSPS
jgi:hypothetical protein